MKKFIFAAAVLVGLALAGCTKDNPVAQDDANARLVLRITNTSPRDTRAVEAPGDETEDLLKDALLTDQSFIFVFDRLGNIVEEAVKIETAALGTTGQLLDFGVPSDAFVYVVANIPSGEVTAVTALTTLEAVQEYTSGIELQVGMFETPTMANVGGAATRIGLATEQEVEDETLLLAEVTVQIKPVISRLELSAIQASALADAEGTITAFDVTGVYVDDYFAEYAYNGLAIEGQDTVKMKQDASKTASWLGAMKDEGEWSAASLVATPDDDDTEEVTEVWGYNVAPGGLPRLIIRLENVMYIPAAGGDPQLFSEEPYYLTVTGYQGLGGDFTPGKVYRIGGEGHELVFKLEHLHSTPNPVDVRLTVLVDVVDWVFEDYTPILAR